ncbi:MAG: ImmA/IrrE family metallo-endopeptidase, partial [Candidatus Hodarchaeales archaeon]
HRRSVVYVSQEYWGSLDPSYDMENVEWYYNWLGGLPSNDPMFPFHVSIFYVGHDMFFGGYETVGVAHGIGRFQYVASPNSFPSPFPYPDEGDDGTTPLIAINSRSKFDARHRRFTTAHEMAHIMGGEHSDSTYIFHPFYCFYFQWYFRYEDSLMRSPYKGALNCFSFFGQSSFSSFFISGTNQNNINAVLNNVY